MEMDRFEAYSDALDTILLAENGKPKSKRNTLGDKAMSALDDKFAKAKGN